MRHRGRRLRARQRGLAHAARLDEGRARRAALHRAAPPGGPRQDALGVGAGHARRRARGVREPVPPSRRVVPLALLECAELRRRRDLRRRSRRDRGQGQGGRARDQRRALQAAGRPRTAGPRAARPPGGAGPRGVHGGRHARRRSLRPARAHALARVAGTQGRLRLAPRRRGHGARAVRLRLPRRVHLQLPGPGRGRGLRRRDALRRGAAPARARRAGGCLRDRGRQAPPVRRPRRLHPRGALFRLGRGQLPSGGRERAERRDRAASLRGARAASGPARPAHGPSEPRPARGPPQPLARALVRHRRARGAAVRRRGPLQAGQRRPRSRRGRQAADERRPPSRRGDRAAGHRGAHRRGRVRRPARGRGGRGAGARRRRARDRHLPAAVRPRPAPAARDRERRGRAG